VVLELGRWAWPRGCQVPHQSRPGARGQGSRLLTARGQGRGCCHSVSGLGTACRHHRSRSGPLAAWVGARGPCSPLAAWGLALASASGGDWDWESGDGGRLGLHDLPFLVGRGLKSWVKKNM
jgi:hypothetical protein